MKREWQAAAAAFQFLSRFPVRAELDFNPRLLGRSVIYYPLVGAAIGTVVWLTGLACGWLLLPLPAAVLILIVWVWLTGGLHLDGWMDAADALLSHRDRDRMLEIMKDSRVGAMGVIACVLLLLLKVSLLYSLLEADAYSLLVLLPMIWSRWFMVHAMQGWPLARSGGGLAGMFGHIGNAERRRAAFWATGLSFLVVLIQIVTDGGMAKAGQPVLLGNVGLLAFVLIPPAAWLAGTWAARRVQKRLGGLTGDIYGALNELLEAVLLLLIVVLHTHL
ncbi:adenosylcobinamide-GDP ribazoletransferase [Paenibacillus sp. JX-17]|uniref:Adenosylcobinamide-GDP ribazoletransferase n=1 Tax=Paenibacillus lacisoli TaxID=3064525 RepID=A0ABT9CDI6_9BACL|nr:adenosylcobinamide-GDP ribazoletransferase [Paenibacillus sp. JX-17]MDO7907337.1 adenosylcobinamide-GDP ribazoletransferase [Paenibacillus sp. JX-17]